MVLLLFLLSACSRVNLENTKANEVPTTTTVMLSDRLASTLTPAMASETETIWVPTLGPSRSPRTTITPSTSPISSNTPLVTLLPLDDIFEIFPLAIGDERVYEVSILYAMDLDDNNDFIYEEWNGLVHELVTEQRITDNGIELDVYRPDYPSVSSFLGVKIGEGTRTLEFREGGVYEKGDPLLLFPLEVGQQWLAFGPDIPEYQWVVETKESVTTPAGSFTNCYRVSLWTRPDHTIIWFCDGIGIVRKTAAHHPPDWIYEWQLYQLP